MGGLVFAPLAIVALGGFGVLILMTLGLAAWIIVLSGRPSSPPSDDP